MSAGFTRETLIALRAARVAHRVATDVAVSALEALEPAFCTRCGRRFLSRDAASGGGPLCASCRAPRVPVRSAATQLLSRFVAILCQELAFPLPSHLVILQSPGSTHTGEADPESGNSNPPSADTNAAIGDAEFETGEAKPLPTFPASSELWRFDGRRLEVLAPTENGSYRPQAASAVFPFLPLADLEQLLVRLHQERNVDAVTCSIRDWIWAATLEV